MGLSLNPGTYWYAIDYTDSFRLSCPNAMVQKPVMSQLLLPTHHASSEPVSNGMAQDSDHAALSCKGDIFTQIP